jgi:hypothetical protein
MPLTGEQYRRIARKILGEKCIICGYNRCINVLHLHHTDPSLKLKGVPFETFEEVENFRKNQKIKLVCRNCHAEIHMGMHPEHLV